MEVKSEQDALEVFNRLMRKEIDNVMSQYANNFRVGKITSVNIESRQVNAEIYGTGEVINGLKYQKGVSYGVFVNDTVLIVSPDAKLRNQNFIVGIY